MHEERDRGGRESTAAGSVNRTARLIRDQAEGCAALGSRLYGGLLRRAAADLEAGGATLRLLVDHLDDPGPSALALRMMGGVHAQVLTGRAPQLAAYYPSAGGSRDPGPDDGDAWQAMVTLLEDRREEIRQWLLRPPQTNEVGRGAALVGGLRYVAAEAPLPIRLLEIGTSAGLNLRADHFFIEGDPAGYGDPDSPVRLPDGWRGVTPAGGTVEIVMRSGADVSPLDPATDADRLRLMSYVWADQVDRLARLRGAIQLAAEVPATISRQPASRAVERLSLVEGTWTVLWHSVVRQYLDEPERRAVDTQLTRIARDATPTARFAHLSLEPRRRSPGHQHEFLIDLQTWPGGARRILGAAAPHGLPTVWEAPG